jgi:putative (di)nucleoside polyphosphate hydrolase
MKQVMLFLLALMFCSTSTRIHAFIYSQLHQWHSSSARYQRVHMSLFSSAAKSPTQFVIDDAGLKWRLCAGAAVFNSRNEILIGERLGKPGSWQTPQGGVDGGDKPETIIDAAIRELYEEVGIVNGKHVLLETTMNGAKARYATEGTGSWLENEGFAGQELNWIIFRCADTDLERNPKLLCNLSGLNGEKPEFTDVRWEKIEWVVQNVWEKKVLPYKILKESCIPIMKRWEESCGEIDFGGRWSRDSTRSVDVVAGLVARGFSEADAKDKAEEPYIQFWTRHSKDRREWVVTTYDADGYTPRRALRYPIGEFEEEYKGSSTIFGGADGGVIKRCCFYLAENEADDQKIAHVTVSETPRGREESKRYLKNGDLILKRTFVKHHLKVADGVESTEVFVRC